MAARKQAPPPRQNRLLAFLPKDVQQRLMPEFETIFLRVRDLLHEANERIEHVYFPLNGVLSLVATMQTGMAIEVATIGNEGMLGLPLFLGVDRTPMQAFSQVAGETLRMPAATFAKHLKREPKLASVLHRYTQALMVQIAQGTACNRAHLTEQRCCRWLLMTHDRVCTDEFVLTQQFLALMLGVRRATVSEVAVSLQKAGWAIRRSHTSFTNAVGCNVWLGKPRPR